MPNWKKVAVSGSSPVFSNITASGNISASGDVYADKFLSNNISVVRHSSGISYFGKTGIPTEIVGNITASIISASGDVYADNLIASGNISASLTSTGSFGRLESHTIGGLSPVTITDDTTIEGNITASGNIQIGVNETPGLFTTAKSTNLINNPIYATLNTSSFTAVFVDYQAFNEDETQHGSFQGSWIPNSNGNSVSSPMTFTTLSGGTGNPLNSRNMIVKLFLELDGDIAYLYAGPATTGITFKAIIRAI